MVRFQADADLNQVIVASSRLFEPQCRRPRRMQWANALCRFRELARVVVAAAALSGSV